jgi:uncharacterized protein
VKHAPLSGFVKAFIALLFVASAGMADRAFAQEPTANQLALGRSLVLSSGLMRSIDATIPQLQEQLIQAITRTRPDIVKDVNDAMTQIKPQLDQKRDELVTISAKIFAKHMSEQEMKDSATFFSGPSGKKYVATQPVVLDEFVTAMDSWARSLSEDVSTLLRVQLKKKNIEF